MHSIFKWVYVLEDTRKHKMAMLTEIALNTFKNSTFETTVQCAVPLFFPLAVWACIIDGLPPFSLAPLLQSPSAPLRWSRCRDQHGAWAADLQAVRSCFFSCILPSTNRDHLILAQKLKRTLKESFFLLLYAVTQSLLIFFLISCFVS